MRGDLVVRVLNWILGLAYLAWVIAGLWMAMRSRRHGDEPTSRRFRWQRRMGRAGVVAGILAAGLAAILPRVSQTAGQELELWMAAAVYVLTAGVVWMWLREKSRASQTRSNQAGIE